MAKKHKHEEHVNHERWLVSFADMMTLLFALFVVLYALGSVELAKLQELKKSVQFAFHIAGEGKTKDTGIFDKQSGAGDVPESAPLLTAQDGEMREFLAEVLPEYEQINGRSLAIDQTDDALTMTAPMSDFFAKEEAYPIRREVQAWLDRALVTSLTFTSSIEILVEVPELTVGYNSAGRLVTSLGLAIERLNTLRRVVVKNPEIQGHVVRCSFQVQRDDPATAGQYWEDRARVILVLSNRRPENR